MVPKGKTMLVMDRMTYEYREGLRQGTDPSQAELEEMLGKVSRLRALSGGMMRDDALGVEVLLDTRDRAEILALRAALRIEENRASFHHCACLGGPTVECYAGKSVIATLSFHHGHGLRWYLWKHDAKLADREQLLEWFNRHGIDANPGESSADPMQFQLLQMTNAERSAWRAHSHLVRGELHQALHDCAKALYADQNCALAYGVRALVYSAERRATECETDCTTAIGLGLKFPEVYFARAVARRSTGDLKEAESDCDAALAFAPEHAGLYNCRGLIRADTGRFDEALADFGRAIELSPEWLVPLAHRALLHEQMRALPRAIEDYSGAITMIEEREKDAPGAPVPDGCPRAFYYCGRGRTLWAMGDRAAAELDFDRAVELEPEDPQALISRAGFAFANSRCETAIWDCTEAIRLRPDFIDAYLARAQIRMALSELDEALDDLNEAVRWSPEHISAILQRGQLLFQMARDEEAVRDFGAVIRLSPEYALGYYLRSFCWRRCRDHVRQRADLDETVRLAPDWSGACNSLSWLLATCSDPSIRDGGRAVLFGRRALENAPEPTRAECLDTLAAALAENGEFAEAIAKEREAIPLMEDIDRRLNYERRLLLYENNEPYREEPAD
jgi:serine/threonine-protein kinase